MQVPESAAAAHQRLERLRVKEHPHCFVCGAPAGRLGVTFAVRSDSSVEATFECADLFQGYPGKIHGGIISSLLDAAMTQCLFARGEVAVTAELAVKFKKPVLTGRSATVTARMLNDYYPLYVMEAELLQDGSVAATATGKFMHLESREPAR